MCRLQGRSVGGGGVGAGAGTARQVRPCRSAGATLKNQKETGGGRRRTGMVVANGTGAHTNKPGTNLKWFQRLAGKERGTKAGVVGWVTNTTRRPTWA